MCGRFSYFIFAYALVRAGGMPFPVRLDTPSPAMTREQMLADTDDILDDYAQDYKNMAE